MPDKDKSTEKEKIKAKIKSEISRLKFATLAEAKDIIAGIQNDVAGFPDLAYLAAIAAEYLRVLEEKENKINNSSVQQTQPESCKFLSDIMKAEMEIIPIKAAVEEDHAKIDNLYNNSKSKDISVANQAIEEILKRNSPEQMNSFAQNAVRVAEKRKEQLRYFEEIKRLSGGELDGGLKKQYETLNAIDTKEKAEFGSNIGKRLVVQAASDLANELEERGLITKETDEDKKHYNAVRAQRIIEEDRDVKAAIAQGEKDVTKATYDNPNVGNACSKAFNEAKGRVNGVIDRKKFLQKFNENLAQEKPVAESAVQTASSRQQHTAGETTQNIQVPKEVLAKEAKKTETVSPEQSGNAKVEVSLSEKSPSSAVISKQQHKAGETPENSQAVKEVLAQDAKKTTTESIGQSGNTKGEASSSEKSPSSAVISKQQQELERMKKAKEAAKSAGIIDGLKPKPKTTDLSSPNPSVQTGKPSHADTVKQGRNSSSKDTAFSR